MKSRRSRCWKRCVLFAGTCWWFVSSSSFLFCRKDLEPSCRKTWYDSDQFNHRPRIGPPRAIEWAFFARYLYLRLISLFCLFLSLFLVDLVVQIATLWQEQKRWKIRKYILHSLDWHLDGQYWPTEELILMNVSRQRHVIPIGSSGLCYGPWGKNPSPIFLYNFVLFESLSTYETGRWVLSRVLFNFTLLFICLSVKRQERNKKN